MRHCAWIEHLKPESPFSVTHFLQQDHTYFNNATPPNSVIPYESKGAVVIQTTTKTHL